MTYWLFYIIAASASRAARWKGKPSALITAAEIRRSTIIKSASAVSAVRKCARIRQSR